MRTAIAYFVRIATVLLLCAAFALPATAIEPGTEPSWFGRISAHAHAVAQRLLAFVVPHENSERAGPPAAFCGHIDPSGCAQGEAPPEPVVPETVTDPETGRFCGDIDPSGCVAP